MRVLRRAAILRLTGLAIAVFASACTLLVDTSDLDSHRVVLDGGTDAREDVARINEPPDSSADAEAGVDACSLQDAGLSPILPLADKWTLRGSAVESDEGVLLTPAMQNQAGAVWSNEVVDFDQFDVSFVFRIEGSGEIADGMTFAWANGDATIPMVGDNGGGLGVSGLYAYAVAIDTYSDPATNPFVAVLDGADTGHPLAQADTGTASVLGSDHTLRARLESGGIVTVWFDGAMLISRYTIPGYTPYRGHWGFTAATGGKVSLQRVSRASYSHIIQACP